MGMAREDEYNEAVDESTLPDEGLPSAVLLERMDAASRESLRLHNLYVKAVKRERNRVPDPGYEHFTFEVRFKGNRTTYHFAARRMKDGSIYTTGVADSRFPTWGAFVRWLRMDDKVYVSPLTKLEPTDQRAVVR